MYWYVPLENAHECGFYDEMITFIRSLFESSLKTNSSLEFAIITGCLRISKESIFTGMNNLKIISVLNKLYDEYFGFTDIEVKKICEDYQMSHKYAAFKEWYDGYIFGDANVYNPWSVIQFMDELCADENQYPKPYWANTSSNSIVRKLIEVADKFNQLEKTVDEALAQIEDRGYARELEDDGYATVYRYGIAFCGKDCLVKLATKHE